MAPSLPDTPRFLSAEAVERALGDDALIEKLREAFRLGATVPLRHHHTISMEQRADATLLLMPAWTGGRHIGVKTVTVFPDNATLGLPSVMGIYLLLDGRSGAPVAILDGTALTRRRTAAASALAARYLARRQPTRMLMVGAGALAPHLIRAHATSGFLRDVAIWNRDPGRAEALAGQLDSPALPVRATADLEGAARAAGLISCATLAREPLIHGAWLSPGCHLDLVGGFTPEMREADDEAVRRARLFVDTREGGLGEAGDIVDPLRRGVISAEDIAGDLAQLCRGTVAGRGDDAEITLFKSVGTALEDLAAAELAVAQA